MTSPVSFFVNASGRTCANYAYTHPKRKKLYVGSTKYKEILTNYLDRIMRYPLYTDEAEKEQYKKRFHWSLQEKFEVLTSIG